MIVCGVLFGGVHPTGAVTVAAAVLLTRHRQSSGRKQSHPLPGRCWNTAASDSVGELKSQTPFGEKH